MHQNIERKTMSVYNRFTVSFAFAVNTTWKYAMFHFLLLFVILKQIFSDVNTNQKEATGNA